MIKDCKFIYCTINNGCGKCVSTNEIKCDKIPDCFNEDLRGE